MKNFDPKYNNIPKTEIHCHLEGAIRTQTIIDIAREHKLKLPAYEVAELDKHLKVYDQLRDLEAVLAAIRHFSKQHCFPGCFWAYFMGIIRRLCKAEHQAFRSALFTGLGISWSCCGLGCMPG
jgi:hypothetical protein